jgi:hypothetical protein
MSDSRHSPALIRAQAVRQFAHELETAVAEGKHGSVVRMAEKAVKWLNTYAIDLEHWAEERPRL